MLKKKQMEHTTNNRELELAIRIGMSTLPLESLYLGNYLDPKLGITTDTRIACILYKSMKYNPLLTIEDFISQEFSQNVIYLLDQVDQLDHIDNLVEVLRQLDNEIEVQEMIKLLSTSQKILN